MKWLGTWNRFELVWLLAFSFLALAIMIQSQDSFFGFTVFLSGILCVVLAAKGHILKFAVGLYNCVGYGIIAYANGLYGEFLESIFFFIPTSILGYLLWKRHTDGGTVRMRRLTRKADVILGLIAFVATLLVGYGLSMIAGQQTPYLDASTNVLNVLATLLMMLRYREQWACYIATNILSVVLWCYWTAAGSSEGLLMLLMWSAYLVNSIYGYWNWTRGSASKEEQHGKNRADTGQVRPTS